MKIPVNNQGALFPSNQDEHLSLRDKFLVPPFTILDTRLGYWQQRRHDWLALGIKSEIGRSASTYDTDKYIMGNKDFGAFGSSNQTNTSIFDPVLCEIAYRWFCPSTGTILDPFAGGSVRGIVASKLGKRYIGVELSEQQVLANREQADLICTDSQPTWIIGDSAKDLPNDAYDMVFSCPPYGNLEVYSDNPVDLSAMVHDEFLKVYTNIIRQACDRLKQNRFAVFVVGDFRDSDGAYRCFTTDTILAFKQAGLCLYNHAILVNSVGSLPIRISNQFPVGHKLGKMHQDVLVFWKGSAKDVKQTLATWDNENGPLCPC